MTSTADDIVAALTKKHPEVLKVPKQWGRLPTGIFPLDLALGGGLPLGKMTQLFGPESSGKTNIALSAIANFQKLYPELRCVYVDVENAFDPLWAKKFGIDTDTLIVVRPFYGEQAVDMVEAFANADDVGLIVLDSLAAMVSTKEVEKDASHTHVAGNAVLIQLLAKKVLVAQLKRQISGMPPTFIGVNQVRMQVGQMWGNPEQFPGGRGWRHMIMCNIRVWGKDVVVKEIDPKLPAWKETRVSIQKNKMQLIALNAEYLFALHPDCPIAVTRVDDWKLVLGYLKTLEFLTKGDTGGWVLLNKPYQTQVEIQDRYFTDDVFRLMLQGKLLSRCMEVLHG